MVAPLSVPGKSEIHSNSVSAGRGGDLLLSLALGEAHAERLTEKERASIAIETPLTRALRWATSGDGARHLALVGPPGTGKTFAVRTADRYGMVGFELPSAGAANAGEIADGIVAALRENHRLLITARPDDLRTWAARADLNGALAAVLQEVGDAARTRDERPPLTTRSIDVFDLSFAVTLHGDVLDELLRRAASLALGPPRDAAREAASSAVRNGNVRAWARACAREAERRVGPLTIAELWRFVATLACGARPARDRTRFDLADSVAARLLRHDFASEALRAFARRTGTTREEALAAHAGFDGAPEDVYCSDPQSLAGQSAVFLVEPPSLDTAQDDYRGLLTRVMGGAHVSAEAALSAALAGSLMTLATVGARRAPSSGGTEGPEEASAPAIQVSAGAPNPLMRRAFGDAWTAALLVRCGDRSLVLGARTYEAIRDLAARGGPDAVARHPDVAAWCRAAPLSLEQHARESPPEARIEAAQDSAKDRGINAGGAVPNWRDSSFARHPLGLLFALSARGTFDDMVTDGGAFRVASPADLALMSPALSSHPEHVERWRAEDLRALGAPVREFIDARAGLIDMLAGRRSPSNGSRALDACLSLALKPATETLSSASFERYLSTYAALMEAAIAAGGEVLDRALMLDIAYCPTDGQRRARLIPLHPLMVARHGLPEDQAADVLPPVIAMSHHRIFALYAEGEPGFYHGELERWPTIAEQRGAVRDASRAWLQRASEAPRLDVDLIDARFAPLLVAEIASCVAEHTRDRRATPPVVRARTLASSLPRAAWLALMTDVEMDGVSVTCDPSVRSTAEARRDAFVFAVLPAPHGGRRPGLAGDRRPLATASYLRALDAARIDARPHRLEHSTEPAISCAAFISWSGSALDDGHKTGQWRLTLRDDLASPLMPTDQASHGVAPSAQQSSVGQEPIAPGMRTEPDIAPPSERARESDEHKENGAPPGSDQATAPDGRRRWTRQALREQVARALGRPPYASDEALVADVVRDVVSARRCPLRHVVVREVVESVGSLIEHGDPPGVVSRTVDTLVDLGDLVARRSSERGPYLLELASAAFVELRGATRTILLGRAEAALSDQGRASVVTAGSLRALDLVKSRDALEELRFRGASEIAWDDWVRVPQYGGPDDALGQQTELKPFQGKLEDYDAFEPTTPPNYYRGRFRRGQLERVLERDRWAVATRDASFGAKERRLFRRADGAIMSVELEDLARFIELAAACAARAAAGGRFMATEDGRTMRLYFPPPRWLARVLAMGQPVDPGDALVAWRIPAELLEDVRSALRRGLWCDVVSG